MKKLMKSLLILIFVMSLSQLSFGQGITGTAHDFSADTWNTSGEICVVCHTPHDANTAIVDAPLWNHEVTTAAFTVYTGYDMQATVGQPASSSKLCLSCHDGTVALENFGGTNNGNNFISGGALIGTDLSNDHPISFTYDAALSAVDGGLHDPTTTNSGLGNTISDDLLAGGDQLQCSSCHDVHNTLNVGSLLIKDNTASALCLTCHNK